MQLLICINLFICTFYAFLLNQLYTGVAVEGMSEINNVNLHTHQTSMVESDGVRPSTVLPYMVKVLTPTTFSIGCSSTYSLYIRNGLVSELDTRKVMNFESLEMQIKNPTLCDTSGNAAIILLCFRTLRAYTIQYGRAPHPWYRSMTSLPLYYDITTCY